MDLAPAQTVMTGERESSRRSADSSYAGSRCTPPMPPVATTSRPATVQSSKVAATVVAPSSPRAAAQPRSRADTLMTPSRRRNRSRSSPSRPMVASPRTSATTAGTAPCATTARRMRWSASRFAGIGRPWARTELSRATTARSRRATATAGDQRTARGRASTRQAYTGARALTIATSPAVASAISYRLSTGRQAATTASPMRAITAFPSLSTQ